MQFVPNVQGKPFKMEEIDVDIPLRTSDSGDVILQETKEYHFKKEEILKVLTEINDRIKYYEYELSEEYINLIRADIVKLKKKKNIFLEFLNNGR